MPEPSAPAQVDPRRTYEAILAHALRYARRILPADQAFEIAHEVALEMLDRPDREPPTGPTLYVAITRRRRDAWRAAERRAAREGTYLAMGGGDAVTVSAADEVEARELRDRVRDVVNGMPPAMREVFRLVREEELTYQEAAVRLGIGVATVHTQLARAAVLLRECVRAYRGDAAVAATSRGGRQP